jgi:polyhydroxybutyrate depolymerase
MAVVVGLTAYVLWSATGRAGGEVKVVRIVVGGQPRSYRLFVPTKLPADNARLIVALHPLRGTPATFESESKFDRGAADTGTLVAYPAGYAHSWNAGVCCGQAVVHHVDDVAFLDAVIDDIEAHYAVDPHRIAIGGFSNGAMMSYRYLCARSSRVHSVFVGSGALLTPSCRFSQPVQVLQFHGMSDPVLPWAGRVAASVNAVARADGCATRWRASTVSSDVSRYAALGCPAGASVLVFRSQPLVHGWVTGPEAMSRFGIDETDATWSWLAAIWSS